VSYAHIFAARDLDADLDPRARHILLALATFTDADGITWVGSERLGAATGYHPVTVRKILGTRRPRGLKITRRHGMPSLFDLSGLSTTCSADGRGCSENGGVVAPGATGVVAAALQEQNRNRSIRTAAPRAQNVYRDAQGYVYVTDDQLSMEV